MPNVWVLVAAGFTVLWVLDLKSKLRIVSLRIWMLSSCHWVNMLMETRFFACELWADHMGRTWDSAELGKLKLFRIQLSFMLLTSPPTKKSKYPHGASGFLSGEEGEMINSGRGQAVDPNPLCVLVYYSSCWHYEFGSYNSTGFIGENATEFDFFSPLPGLWRVSTQMMNFGSPRSDDLSPTTNVSSRSWEPRH